MNIFDGIKKIFPQPKIPQKRYLILLGIVLYAVAKVYVTITPTPTDDDYPDQARDLIVKYFADAQDDPNYEDEGRHFGEAA